MKYKKTNEYNKIIESQIIYIRKILYINTFRDIKNQYEFKNISNNIMIKYIIFLFKL